MRGVLLDAGPFVAVVDRDDAYHARCVRALQRLRGPLVTAWPIVSEAMHLLGAVPDGQEALWGILRSDAVALVDLGSPDLVRMQELMRKYRDLPMDLAAAALVRLAERERLQDVLTIDGDFGVYRIGGRRRFRLVPLS